MRELTGAARKCSALSASIFAWSLRIFAPTLALGIFSSSAETGLYGGSHRLVMALHTFVWLYFFNLLPSISRTSSGDDRRAYRDLMRQSTRFVSWMVLPGCLALSISSDAFLPAIYGEGFEQSSANFRILIWMPAAAFYSGHHLYSLIAFGHAGTELRASLVGALVVLGGVGVLVFMGQLDARSVAWALLLAEIGDLGRGSCRPDPARGSPTAT